MNIILSKNILCDEWMMFSKPTYLRWYEMTLIVDLLIKMVSSAFVTTRGDGCWSGTTDGGTSELCVVFLLGEWLYILTVWLAFRVSCMLTHWCFQRETKFTRYGLDSVNNLYEIWEKICKTVKSPTGLWLICSIMPVFIHIERWTDIHHSACWSNLPAFQLL